MIMSLANGLLFLNLHIFLAQNQFHNLVFLINEENKLKYLAKNLFFSNHNNWLSKVFVLFGILNIVLFLQEDKLILYINDFSLYYNMLYSILFLKLR